MVVLGTTRHLLVVVVHTCEVLLLLGLGEEGVREPFAGCCVEESPPAFSKADSSGPLKGQLNLVVVAAAMPHPMIREKKAASQQKARPGNTM